MARIKNKPQKNRFLRHTSYTLIVLMSFLTLTTSACQFLTPEGASIQTAPKMTSQSNSTAETEPTLETTPEQRTRSTSESIETSTQSVPASGPLLELIQEVILREAYPNDSLFTVNGLQTPFHAYVIDELIFIDIFELAYALTDTDKHFYPSWDEHNNTLDITSGIPYYSFIPEFSQISTSSLTATPIEKSVYFNDDAVTIPSYYIEENIFFDLFTASAMLDLIIHHDTSKNTYVIYTSQAIADAITRLNRIDPSLPMVALTFDDGPSRLTGQVLDILERYNAVATFYVIGRQVETHRDTVLRAYEMGNEIANHTWSHWSLDQVSAEGIRTQLRDTNNAVESVTGTPPSSMRPPFGSYNSRVQSVARDLGLPIVTWSVDPSDYLPRNVDTLYNFIMDRVSDRDIILLHDIHERSVATTRRLVPSLIDRGYQLVTVSELMYFAGITPEPGGVYRHGRN